MSVLAGRHAATGARAVERERERVGKTKFSAWVMMLVMVVYRHHQVERSRRRRRKEKEGGVYHADTSVRC